MSPSLYVHQIETGYDTNNVCVTWTSAPEWGCGTGSTFVFTQLSTGQYASISNTQSNQTTIPPQASWPPSHFSSVRPAPARSIHCMQLAQPGGPGTPSSPRSESRHREYPFSAGHWGPGGCWCSGLWTHTHTWGSQASHPQTCRSHPERKRSRVTTIWVTSEGEKELHGPLVSLPWDGQKGTDLLISIFMLSSVSSGNILESHVLWLTVPFPFNVSFHPVEKKPSLFNGTPKTFKTHTL